MSTTIAEITRGLPSDPQCLPVPPPTDRLHDRSTPSHARRALRRARVRSELAAETATEARIRETGGASERRAHEAARDPERAAPRPADAVPGNVRTAARIAGASLLALLLLIPLWIPAITTPVAVGLLGAIAAAFALVSAGSLARLVLTDIRARAVRTS